MVTVAATCRHVAGAIDAAKPLLDAIGQRSLAVSREPQVANAVKLSCNFLIASVIESLGEAMAFIARNGVDQLKLERTGSRREMSLFR